MQRFIIFAVDLRQIFTSKIDIYAPIVILSISSPQKLKSCDKKRKEKRKEERKKGTIGVLRKISGLLNYYYQIIIHKYWRLKRKEAYGWLNELLLHEILFI